MPVVYFLIPRHVSSPKTSTWNKNAQHGTYWDEWEKKSMTLIRISQPIGQRRNMTEEAEDKAKKVAALRDELKKAKDDLNDAKAAKEKVYTELEDKVEEKRKHAEVQELVKAKKKKRKKRIIKVLKFTLKVAAAAYLTYLEEQGY
jgi:DNA repair exonuclease SbcCD ATPase subunit